MSGNDSELEDSVTPIGRAVSVGATGADDDIATAERESLPRLGHGLRWSDVVADIERDQAERERLRREAA